MKRERIYQKTRERQDDVDYLPGYPEYSSEEDIYVKGKEEGDIDPENIYGIKDSGFEENPESDEAGLELDIPGSELDDDMEETGNEDEENNYYSLSDEHNDDLEDLI